MTTPEEEALNTVKALFTKDTEPTTLDRLTETTFNAQEAK